MANCTYSVPNKELSGDNYYGQFICREELVDYFWYAYGFAGNKDYWDDGFGWHDCCNTDQPLGRTYNACYLLTYSAEDYRNESWDGPCLNWARRYVRKYIDDLRSRCSNGTARATAFWGCQDDRVELYMGFFYNSCVVDRASILLHEARHMAAGKLHSAEFPPHSFLSGTGADPSWEYKGAYMYQVLYLWWFSAEGKRTTSATRQRAKDMGNLYLDNYFAVRPGFSI